MWAKGNYTEGDELIDTMIFTISSHLLFQVAVYDLLLKNSFCQDLLQIQIQLHLQMQLKLRQQQQLQIAAGSASNPNTSSGKLAVNT